METETKPQDFAKMKAYTVYIGVVEDLSDELKEENPTDEMRFDDIGEHRTISLWGRSVNDLMDQIGEYLKEDEYFMGAVVNAIFEHKAVEQLKTKLLKVENGS